MMLCIVLILQVISWTAHADWRRVAEIFGYNQLEDDALYEEWDSVALRKRALEVQSPPFNLLVGDMHYDGGLVGTERHGFGVLTIGGNGHHGSVFKPGAARKDDSHVGVFRRNRRHGAAVVEVWNDGDNTSMVYVGDYWNDKQHGYGRLQVSNGDLYVGSWLYGFQWGYGSYTSLSWSYEGQWVQGEPHGYGKETFSNGTVREGLFDMGRIVGAEYER
jgi:hypothetical protein